jgi:flagellar biogenesis protein FliO
MNVEQKAAQQGKGFLIMFSLLLIMAFLVSTIGLGNLVVRKVRADESAAASQSEIVQILRRAYGGAKR